MTKQFPFKIDVRLRRKLDNLIETLEKRDVWMLIDGDEGSGKTNTAAFLLYYFHCVTGRDFSLERFYFDSDAMFNWVKNNSNGLVNWDEAALGGLSTEWWSHSQMNLMKFAMVGRKKHHVFILCIPRFNKLKEDLRCDRIHGMLHMDLGKKGKRYGHFIYLTRRGIRFLNGYWKKKKVRAYAKAVKHGGFFADVDIPLVFSKILNEEEYERKKDEAISQIGEKKKDDKDNVSRQELKDFKKMMAKLEFPIKNTADFCEKSKIPYDTYHGWRKTLVRDDDSSKENGKIGIVGE